MKHLRFILAVLALARFVGAQATQPADPVQRDLQQAQADYAAGQASGAAAMQAASQQVQSLQTQLANSKLQIASLSAQLTTNSSQPTTRPWLLINDEANKYGFICRWADQTRSACGFFDLSGGKQPFTYSGNGYPIGSGIQARSFMYMLGAPAGNYAVTWTGNATLKISGLGGVTYQSTGPNSGVLTLPAEGAMALNQWGWNPTEQVTIDVTASDPQNPLDNLHVWTPGYGPGSAHAGQMYDDRYLALVKVYGGVRTMNSSGASSSSEVNWSDRITPSMYDWTNDVRPGVPIEADVELLKESGLSTWWVCVPPKANQDYRQRMAKLIHDSLPGVTVLPEWGNEDWNLGGGFAGAAYVDQLANQTSPQTWDGAIVNGQLVPDAIDPTGKPVFVTDGIARRARCAFDLARACAQDFAAAWADRPGQCLPAFGAQAGDSYWAASAYAWGHARYGSTQPFKILAIAPYVDFWSNNGVFYKATGPGGADTLTDLFTACDRFLADNTQRGDGLEFELASNGAVARAEGQELDDYEGGESWQPQLVGGNYTGTDLSTQGQTDPRMGFMYDDYYARLHRGGVRRHCSFALIGSRWDKSGFWSLLQTYEDATSPTAYRWQADVREARRSN